MKAKFRWCHDIGREQAVDKPLLWIVFQVSEPFLSLESMAGAHEKLKEAVIKETNIWFFKTMKKSALVVVRKPFIKLVKLVANAFYDDITMKSATKQKSARLDNRGFAVVVLVALTRRQWVREEDFAKELTLPTKQLRKLLKHFEEQRLIMRDHRKETAKGAKDKVKVQTHSYCCLDYSQIYDIVRYKLHRMKKMLKDELEAKNTVQEYGCPNCQKKYNALDAMRLISMEDDSFHCEKCNGELVVECNKLTSEQVVDGDDNAKRQEKLKDSLQKLEVQLKPLTDHINRIKDLPVPEFESLSAWETRAAMAARENGDLNLNDPSRSQGWYGSTSMPFLGETEVEVILGEGKEDVESKCGEMREEAKVDDGGSEGAAMENGDDKYLKDQYIKGYLADKLEQRKQAEKLNQQEFAGGLAPDIQLTTTSSCRQVGMKSKREEEDEEEAPVAANGNYKVDLINVKAEALGGEEDEEEDVGWIEG